MGGINHWSNRSASTCELSYATVISSQYQPLRDYTIDLVLTPSAALIALRRELARYAYYLACTICYHVKLGVRPPLAAQ